MNAPLDPSGVSAHTVGSLRNAHHFAHEAMATVFELYIATDDSEYARQAGQEAFQEVDRLERELSRFISNSDISRLNRLAPGEPLMLGLETYDCLRWAQQLYHQTAGAFDITIGSLYQCWIDAHKNLKSPTPEELEDARKRTGMHHLQLDPDGQEALVTTAGVRFDLGGIGKGYAADRIAELLEEWSLPRVLIIAGASTILARQPPPQTQGWPITISNPNDRRQILAQIELAHEAVGGSGIQQGQHIIDPRPKRGHPIQGRLAAWSLAPQAVVADAMSTAFMILEPPEIARICRESPDISGMVMPADHDNPPSPSPPQRFGPWPHTKFFANTPK